MDRWTHWAVERVGRNGVAIESIDDVVKCRVLDRFWMLVDPADQELSTCIMRDGYWEAWVTTWILNNVRPGSRCMDLGANVGYYSLLLASMGCDVICFEPQPKLAELLQRSAVLNGLDDRITVEVVALSGDDRGAIIHVPDRSSSGASIRRTSGPDETEFAVPTTTLDHYRGMPVDFLKVDIEAAEEQLIAGAAEFIREHPDASWLVEWRWLGYDNPIELATKLFNSFSVHYLDGNGNAVPVPPEPFHLSLKDDWQMLALLPRAARH